MTPEGVVKRKINGILSQANSVWWMMPVQNGMGKASLDYIGWRRGQAFAIEAKAPGKVPTPRQETTIRNMREGGAVIFVVDGTEKHPYAPLMAWPRPLPSGVKRCNLGASAKHRMVGVPVTPQLMNLFPSARQLSPDLMAIPHTLDVVKMLRNLGFDVPAPVLTQYDWAGGAPFEVQKKTVAMLTTEKRAYVLSGFGTGKTKAALWAFDALRQQGRANKMLVVAPLSTLSFVWAREVLQTVPHLKVAILHGERETRLERLADVDADIYVINHDGVKIIAPFLPSRPDINVLCIDELATYRNWNKRTKLMRAPTALPRLRVGVGHDRLADAERADGRLGPGADPDARARQRALDALPRRADG